MRSIREQPFCWQEKSVFRLLRKKFQKSELIKMRCLYGAITEMDSDFNGKEIKYYTKSIYTYSGLSKDWIPQGLKQLEKLGIIKIQQQREKGKYKGKNLYFTGKIPQKTVTEESFNGKSFNGLPDTSEHNSLLEDITSLEDNKKKSVFLCLKEHFPDEWKKDRFFKRALKEFTLHRKEKHRPITARAGKMLAKELCKYSMQEATNALIQSIKNDWIGVFPAAADKFKPNAPSGTREYIPNTNPHKYAEADARRKKREVEDINL